jgi:hypothetical protein
LAARDCARLRVNDSERKRKAEQTMTNDEPNGQSPVDGMLGGVNQQAQDRVGGVIDSVASKVPGGDAFAQQAKDMAGGALGGLEQQAEQQIAEKLGGALGGLGGLGGVLGGALGGLLGGHGGAAPTEAQPAAQGEAQSNSGQTPEGQSGQSGS